MRTILIVLVVLVAVSVASAGPRITVILSVGGGGCGPGYRPMPMPTYRPAPYGGYCAPQAQLIRCSLCFQVRPVGTICICQQRNYGCGNSYVAQGGYGYQGQGGYLPQGGYNNQISAIEAERRRLGYLSSGYRDLQRANQNFERANQSPYSGGGFGW